jgi:hypothetical protein
MKGLATEWTIGNRFPTGSVICYSPTHQQIHIGCGEHPISYSPGRYRGLFFKGYIVWGVKLSLHVVAMLKFPMSQWHDTWAQSNFTCASYCLVFTTEAIKSLNPSSLYSA